MDEMSSSDESAAEPMSTDILEDIRDGSQSSQNINRREACYKIRNQIKQRQGGMERSIIINMKYGKRFTQIISGCC